MLNPYRILRLQFSLRALLVLMAVVGFGRVIFRRPWVETELKSYAGNLLTGEAGPGSDLIVRGESGRWEHSWRQVLNVSFTDDVGTFRVTTTYRRGWNAAPQRHGVQQFWLQDDGPDSWFTSELPKPPRLVVERHYVDDDLRRLILFDEAGKPSFSEGYQNGLPHGQSGVSADFGGRYDHGRRVGVWHTSYFYPHPMLLHHDKREKIAVQESYRDGVLHGEWIWKGKEHRILQTARYDNGRLVAWNGTPPDQAVAALLAQCQLTPDNLARLQRPAAQVHLTELTSSDEKFQAHWELQINNQETGLHISARAQSLPPNYHLRLFRPLTFPTNQPPLTALLEEALATSETLVVRNHELHVIKISTAEIDADK